MLLLFFDKAGQCQLAAQIVVVGVAGKLMGEPIRFKFRAVGQNDPRLGIRIDRPFIVRPGIELPPVLKCLVNGTRSFRKRVHIVTPCKIFHLQLYAKPRGGCALRAGRSFVLFFTASPPLPPIFSKTLFPPPCSLRSASRPRWAESSPHSFSPCPSFRSKATYTFRRARRRRRGGK